MGTSISCLFNRPARSGLLDPLMLLEHAQHVAHPQNGLFYCWGGCCDCMMATLQVLGAAALVNACLGGRRTIVVIVAVQWPAKLSLRRKRTSQTCLGLGWLMLVYCAALKSLQFLTIGNATSHRLQAAICEWSFGKMRCWGFAANSLAFLPRSGLAVRYTANQSQ